MRRLLTIAFMMMGSAAMAATPAISPSPAPVTQHAVRPDAFEIVKSHIDIQVNADGSFAEAAELAARPLTAIGAELLRQTTLSYTDGYESVDVTAAYTLKADGTRIDVPASGYLEGRGVTSSPGFQDIKTRTIVFPSLDVGDQAVLITLTKQKIPWFKNQFALADAFDNAVVARDIKWDVSAPASLPLFVESAGVQGGKRDTVNGNTHWNWTFSNEKPAPFEMGAVSAFDEGAHIVISSYPDAAAVAKVYVDAFRNKAKVTPEIQKLADQLTAGISDRRGQAQALYNWVSSRIAYVNIVLGAGGFTPHEAGHILESRYGDCKDHVMLLQALLAAKGIASTPVLINTRAEYRTPSVVTPFGYDHLITYIPELKLYLDSTARYAGFGLLPPGDDDKPVLLVSSGVLTRTPVLSAKDNSLRSVGTLTYAKDGSAEGDTKVTARGSAAFALRALLSIIPPNKESDYFHLAMGPEAEGSLSRSNVDDLSPEYSFSAHYHLPNAAQFPGPGAISPGAAYKPFTFTTLIAPALPSARTRSYVCTSLTAQEDVTINLPPGVKPTFLPKPENITVEGASLRTNFVSQNPGVIHETAELKLDHPAATCSPQYYGQNRAAFSRMLAALRAQIIYQ